MFHVILMEIFAENLKQVMTLLLCVAIIQLELMAVAAYWGRLGSNYTHQRSLNKIVAIRTFGYTLFNLGSYPVLMFGKHTFYLGIIVPSFHLDFIGFHFLFGFSVNCIAT